jgi:outer membrane protein assembly factor BamE (lipoprotein component of BamABCDE complex)
MKYLLGILGFAFLISCASSPHESLQKVRVGMDKNAVLDIAGNPTRTERQDGQDIWYYAFYRESQEWLRAITFAGGKVVNVGKSHPKSSWTKDLENSASMEEYEQKVRERQNKSSNFKDVKGGE